LLSGAVSKAPLAYAQLMVALDFALGPSYEVVVVGNPLKEDTNRMLGVLRRNYIPNMIVLFRSSETNRSEITEIAKFTQNLNSLKGKATAYVCHEYACDFPTTEIDEMLKSLGLRHDFIND